MSIDVGIRHLRAVVAVAEEGGFSAAARRVGVAQSSLSRTIAEAERRLGVTLFERTTRQVRPTREGEQLVVMARRVLEEFDGALAHFDGYLAGERGSVAVAALPSVAATLLPGVLAGFRASRPDVGVTVRDALSADVLRAVREGAVDMAVTVAPDVPEEILSLRVAVDRFALVAPYGHRLLAADRTRWADLAGEPFVGFDHGSSIRLHTDRALAVAGVKLGHLTEAGNIGAVAGLTAAGLGVTASPGLVLPMMGFAGLDWRPLVDPDVRRDICLLRHRDRPLSRTAAALVTMLLDASEQEIAIPELVEWLR